jgi:WD40 repeat protein
LTGWLVERGCRVVGVLGLGGIGKSALAVSVMHQVAERFEVVIWRSLRDAPACEALLDGCLQILAPQPHGQALVDLEQRLDLLFDYLRGRRALIVFDNLETLLEEGADTGRMRPGYEGYERLLRRAGEIEHQSCLLFTSREKPIFLAPLEGSQSSVRMIRLARLEFKPCEQLLAAKGVAGTDSDRARLIDIYAGNPLALNIVAQTIVDLFAGDIAPFLDQGEIIFGSIRTLLAEQFGRLSALEQSVLLWLAILREPSSLDDLLALLVTPVSRARLLETVEALHRRSLIERGQTPGSFTLQSVVLEFATARLIAEIGAEIQAGKPIRLIEHSLELAHAREYVRQTQERLIVAPILAHLGSLYREPAIVEHQLLTLLAQFPSAAAYAQGYGPANLVTLLRVHRGHLRGLDLGQLTLRSVYLQGVEMQDTTLAETTVQDSIFTETFDAIYGIAVSSTGAFWAAASGSGEIRVWLARSQTLYRMWRAHTARVVALAFSPDGSTMASGSWDGEVKLWDLASGTLLWSDRQSGFIQKVAFEPGGSRLASAGRDGAMLLDVRSGSQMQILSHPLSVLAVSWSADGKLIATGDPAGTIRLWAVSQTEPARCMHVLTEHTDCVYELAFAPDSTMLASASWDRTVKLWHLASGTLHTTVIGHTDEVSRVAWSHDGRIVAISSRDPTIWLWDSEQDRYYEALRGHTAEVTGLTFVPNSSSLLSGSEDGTLRLWDVVAGECTRIIEGHVDSLTVVDWSPDGTQVVCGGADSVITIYATSGEPPPKFLRGHGGLVFGVGWSADGRHIASNERTNSIRLWDATSGDSLAVLQYPDDTVSFFFDVAWSPDGQHLASGTFRRGVQIFEVTKQRHR